MDDILNWMILSQTPGIGVSGFWQCVRYFGSPAAVLESSEKEIAQIPGIRKNQIQGLLGAETLRSGCVEELERIIESGGKCISFTDKLYPEQLKEIHDPPPLLYVLGDVGLLSRPGIGIVGSRAATSYGNRIALNLAKKVAEQGVAIVSGLALGIDTQAHKGALAAGGTTIAVLGCGVDVVYPKQNLHLFREIQEYGAIVSEYPLGTTPEGFRFPARNRIIAGLSQGVLVVEAARKSGSLITAQLALDGGRDVYAVPGQVDSYKSEGTHWLLQQGAKLVQSERDILEDFALSIEMNQNDDTDVVLPPSLDRRAARLYDCIEAYPQSRNEVISKASLNISEISELLLVLELEGLIEILPGDEIRKVARG